MKIKRRTQAKYERKCRSKFREKCVATQVHSGRHLLCNELVISCLAKRLKLLLFFLISYVTFLFLFFWLLSYSNVVKLTLNLPGTQLLQRKSKLHRKLQSSSKYTLDLHSLMWPTVLDFGASCRSGRLGPLYRRKNFLCSVASVIESLLISRIDEGTGVKRRGDPNLSVTIQKKEKVFRKWNNLTRIW